MGDRALVVFVSKKDSEVSPVIYTHWGGDSTPIRLVECFELMKGCRDDLAYVAARYVGLLHASTGGNTGMGMWNAPTGTFDEILATLSSGDYSHGDAGVFLVHIDEPTWKVEVFHGYGFQLVREPDPEHLKVQGLHIRSENLAELIDP